MLLYVKGAVAHLGERLESGNTLANSIRVGETNGTILLFEQLFCPAPPDRARLTIENGRDPTSRF